MLRSLTNLQLYIHPERIVATRWSGLFSRVDKATHIFPLLNRSSSEPGYIVEALNGILATPDFKNSKVTILVSGRLLKFRVAYWNDELTFDDQIIAIQHQFQQIYGESFIEWNVFLSNSGFKKNELACAIKRNLLESIEAIFFSKSYRLVGVRSYLVETFNKFRTKLPAPCWLFIVEEGGVHLSRFSNAGWERINTRTVDTSNATSLSGELDVLFERERLHAGEYDSITPVYFFWEENPEYTPVFSGYDSIHKLVHKSSGILPKTNSAAFANIGS